MKNDIWKIFGLFDRIILSPATTDRQECLSYQEPTLRGFTAAQCGKASPFRRHIHFS